MKKKVLFITNTFPSNDHPQTGLFNYRAVIGLNKRNNLTVLHLRSWKPFRKFIQYTCNQNIEIFTISLPILLTKKAVFWALQIFFYKRLHIHT